MVGSTRVRTKVLNTQSDQKLYHDKGRGLHEFLPSDQVMIKDLRREDTWCRGNVAERTDPKWLCGCAGRRYGVEEACRSFVLSR